MTTDPDIIDPGEFIEVFPDQEEIPSNHKIFDGLINRKPKPGRTSPEEMEALFQRWCKDNGWRVDWHLYPQDTAMMNMAFWCSIVKRYWNPGIGLPFSASEIDMINSCIFLIEKKTGEMLTPDLGVGRKLATLVGL